MNKSTLLGSMLLIPAMFLFVAVGCSNKKKDEDTGDDGPVVRNKKTGGGGGKGKDTKEITNPMDATVSGVVKVKGKVPERKPLAALHAHLDKGVCTMGDDKEQMWIVDNDGHVANAIVFLVPPKGQRFPDNAKDKATGNVYVDQPQCQYIPHVVGICGPSQKFVAKNSAPLTHNVKISAGAEVGNFDHTLVGKSKDGKIQETPPINLEGAGNEQLVSAVCSVHSWMNAKIAVFNHPYFCRTDEKGAFKIENVPSGVDLTVYLWHESMGDNLNKKVEQKKTSFQKGANDLGVLTVGQ